MDNIVITIARQYGSGGKTVGQMVAAELGIPFYSRDILRMASEDSGISEGLFGEADEKLRKNRLLRFKTNVYDLFNYQAKIIKQLAETESCVIVGRCADFVLRNYPNVMSVFVHADDDFCYEQAMQLNSMAPREMKKFIAKVDKFRGDYYHYYTGRDWNDARNYDLCIDCGKLGFEKCKEEILAYRKIRFGL